MNTGLQAWQQASLPTEPIHWPSTWLLDARSFFEAGVHCLSQVGWPRVLQGTLCFCFLGTDYKRAQPSQQPPSFLQSDSQLRLDWRLVCSESCPRIPDPPSAAVTGWQVLACQASGLRCRFFFSPQTQELEKNLIKHFTCFFLPSVSMVTSGAAAWPATGSS